MIFRSASGFVGVIFGIRWHQVKVDLFSGFGSYVVRADCILMQYYITAPYKSLIFRIPEPESVLLISAVAEKYAFHGPGC